MLLYNILKFLEMLGQRQQGMYNKRHLAMDYGAKFSALHPQQVVGYQEAGRSLCCFPLIQR
jgi:hypothetical protein